MLLKYLKSRSATTKDHKDMKHVALSDIFKNILVKDSNNKNLKVKEKIFSIFTNVMFSAENYIRDLLIVIFFKAIDNLTF